MSESCCQLPRTDSTTDSCPVNGVVGKPVEWLTVAALTTESVPPRQTFWLCRDPNCEVAYFGEEGALVTTSDMAVSPGFKTDLLQGLSLLLLSSHASGDRS